MTQAEEHGYIVGYLAGAGDAAAPLAKTAQIPDAGPEYRGWSVKDREELSRRRAGDQKMRQNGAVPDPGNPVDAGNAAWLRTGVEADGWPGRPEDSVSAFLMAQHSGPGNLKWFHGRMTDPRQKAFAEDRIAVHEGRPQKHGTQTVADRSPAPDWRKWFGFGGKAGR